jgi:hypothetical protein
MSRYLRPIRTLLVPLVLSSSLLTGARAFVLEGVEIPPQVVVQGQTLKLNGAGIRILRPMGIPVHFYVASLYTPHPIRDPEKALEASAPLQFNFVFLKSASKEIVAHAWRAQFSKSATLTYPGFEKDKETFISLLGCLDARGRDTVEFVGEDTVVLDLGKPVGAIRGRDFQRAFLNMLFGPTPASKRLKSELLGITPLHGTTP